jgi:hypothetical protein
VRYHTGEIEGYVRVKSEPQPPQQALRIIGIDTNSNKSRAIVRLFFGFHDFNCVSYYILSICCTVHY